MGAPADFRYQCYLSGLSCGLRHSWIWGCKAPGRWNFSPLSAKWVLIAPWFVVAAGFTWSLWYYTKLVSTLALGSGRRQGCVRALQCHPSAASLFLNIHLLGVRMAKLECKTEWWKNDLFSWLWSGMLLRGKEAACLGALFPNLFSSRCLHDLICLDRMVASRWPGVPWCGEEGWWGGMSQPGWELRLPSVTLQSWCWHEEGTAGPG